jgi:transcriptional regulator with XRE-family HTH domain
MIGSRRRSDTGFVAAQQCDRGDISVYLHTHVEDEQAWTIGPVDTQPHILTRSPAAFSKHLTEEIVMTSGRKSFGALVRREREAKEIGLREMAKKIGVSPTYLSKIERGDFDPPAEDKVRKIAEILGLDPDELLALAGRVASDLTDIIRQRPREMADFLRAAKGLTAEDIARLARQAQKAKEK